MLVHETLNRNVTRIVTIQTANIDSVLQLMNNFVGYLHPKKITDCRTLLAVPDFPKRKPI